MPEQRKGAQEQTEEAERIQMTVFEMNEGELKGKGYYLALVNREMFRKERTMGGDGGGDAEYKIRLQTGLKTGNLYSITEAKNKKREHTVTMTEQEWAVTITALSVYHDIGFAMFRNEIMEEIKQIAIKMGEQYGTEEEGRG